MSDKQLATAKGDKFVLRPTKNAADFHELWWQHMLELGWDRSYNDLPSYIAATHSPGFHLLYPATSTGPQGHVMATIFDNSTAWIAMFIIAPSFRGQGYGAQLFAAAMADVAGVQYIGLDAVREQVPTYQRRGFVASSEGRRVKLMTRPFLGRVPLPTVSSAFAVRDCREVDLSLLVQNEKRVTGFERTLLWSHEYFDRPDVRGVALLDSSIGGYLAGWTVVRRCPGGARVGPVYARDASAAEILLQEALQIAQPAWVEDVPMPGIKLSELSDAEITQQATVVVEVWTDNVTALALFEKLGWHDAGVEYYRMWLHDKPPPEQSAGGVAEKEMWAIYDAAIG